MFFVNRLSSNTAAPVRIPLSHLSTYFTPSHTEKPQQQQPTQYSVELENSIANRPYWTKKIHELCTIHRNVDEALRLLDLLRLRGYRPDSLNLSSFVHALCDARRFDEAHHRFLLSIASLCSPDQRTCNILIARLLDSKTPYVTLQCIRSLFRVKQEFVPSVVNYNRLINQLCAISRPNEAHRLVFDMNKRGHFPNTVTFTTLISGYCRIGEVGDAYKVFAEMREREVVPNSLTYSVLICGVFSKRDVQRGTELMFKLWETMKDVEESVNNAAFSSLINCLCREGFFSDVFRMAEDLPQGCVNEEFAYGQMIDSLCRVGRSHGASRIVYLMRKKGLRPSLVSYDNIVHGLSKGGCMRAYQLLEEGIEFGYSPSEYTYKVLVEGLCHEVDLGKARKVLNVMLNKEGVDRTRIYNIYLRALCLMNNPTELLNVLVFMLETNVKPDVITINTVINGFCKMGRTEEALRVLNDMMMGKFCGPDAVTFTSIICGLLNVGRSQEALNLLFQVMPEKGFSPGIVTYNAVLRGLFKLKEAEEAMKVFDIMPFSGVVADSTTYAIIIEGLCESDRIDEAKKFWDGVIWPSGIHDDYVYAAILKGLCRSDNFEEACHFLYELVDSGVIPNIVNYNILIDKACKRGLKKEAYQIVGEMRKNELAPDAVTWRILDKLHGSGTKQFCEDDSTLQSE